MPVSVFVRPGRWSRAYVFFSVLSLVLCARLEAQRPLVRTIDAAALGSGRAEIVAGAEYAWKGPSVTDPDADRLLRLFPVEARFGAAKNVDVVAGWRGRLIARTGGGTRYTDWGDPYLATKVVLTDSAARAPAVALWWEVKIPSTRYLPARLGSDATDVFFRFLFTHASSSVTVRVNAVFGIIGNPRAPGSQDDIYGGSLMLQTNPAGWAWAFAELSGFTGPREDDDKLQAAAGFGIAAGEGEIGVSVRRRLSGSPVDYGTAFEMSEMWGIAAVYAHRLAF